jgi:hypothetical protein
MKKSNLQKPPPPAWPSVTLSPCHPVTSSSPPPQSTPTLRPALLARLVFPLLLSLAYGCAAPGPPIGVWFTPPAPTTVTITSLPQDKSARLVHTPHYDIYTTLGDDDMVQRVAQTMEGSLTAYQTLAPGVPLTPYPMKCFIFSKRAQWAEFTRENTGAQASLYLQINRGGYTVGDWYVAYYIGQTSTLSVAAHEGWHQYVARNFKARLPPFLEEGLATMFEGVRFKDGLPHYNLSINQERAIALRTAIDGNFLWPLDQLIGMHAGMILDRPGEKIDAWYAQAWGLGRFLWDADNGKYRPALRQILQDTANGTVFDPTGPPHRTRLVLWSEPGVKAMLEHYLQMDWPDIDAAYNRFIRHVADDEIESESAEPG